MDLREQLRNQISFIRTSCEGYDRGQVIEAIRVAAALRVLFHDTGRQTSLLTQLGAKQIRILSTVAQVHPNVVFFSGMSPLRITSTNGTVRASLGDAATKIPMPRLEWWQQVVSVVGSLRASRKDIVLGAANKEGGAHVDPQMSKDYRKLREGIWARVHYQGGREIVREPIRGTQLVCLRQMGYEVLNSPELIALTNSPRL